MWAQVQAQAIRAFVSTLRQDCDNARSGLGAGLVSRVGLLFCELIGVKFHQLIIPQLTKLSVPVPRLPKAVKLYIHVYLNLGPRDLKGLVLGSVGVRRSIRTRREAILTGVSTVAH